MNLTTRKNTTNNCAKVYSSLAGVFAFAIVAVALTAITTTSAHAQSRTCKRLEAQLASVSSGRSSVSKRYAKAIRSQKQQIRKVERSLRSYGCASKKRLFKREAHGSCGNLRSTLGRMKSNLASLNRNGSSKSNSRSERRRINRALKRNSCGQYANLNKTKKRRTIIERVFGKSKKQRRREQASRELRALKNDRKKNSRDWTPKDNLSNYRTVRTVCVRTCDGYHFPVSYSTHKSNVERDTEACANLCPGTETELYVHRTRGETAQNMTSVVTGLPYTELPKAFAFQESYNAQCKCNYRLLKREKASIEVSPEEQERLDEQAQRRIISRIALPAWRSDRGQDPETMSNRKGLLTLETIQTLKKVNDDTKVATRTRKIRVIGEEFLPNQ